MSTGLPLLDYIAERDAALARVSEGAGNFIAEAMVFVRNYLRANGEASGETITDACKEAGIKPPRDDRAFGPVFMNLIRDQIIEKCGECKRTKGHGTSGGSIYRIKR